MNIGKNQLAIVSMVIVGLLAGFMMKQNSDKEAMAQYNNGTGTGTGDVISDFGNGIGNNNMVSPGQSEQQVSQVTADSAILGKVYTAVFHRPMDAGANFHVGRNLHVVLNDIINSEEHRYYSAVFKAVKAYEEARRAPVQLTEQEKALYLDTINSALGALVAWVETLPTQDPCRAVVDSQDAKLAIQQAYNSLDTAVRSTADFGVFDEENRLGPPSSMELPRDLCPSPLVTPNITSPTFSPSTSPATTVSPTASPTLSPTISPTFSPSPTLSPTFSPTPTFSPSPTATVSPTFSPTPSPTVSPTTSPGTVPTMSPNIF